MTPNEVGTQEQYAQHVQNANSYQQEVKHTEALEELTSAKALMADIATQSQTDFDAVIDQYQQAVDEQNQAALSALADDGTTFQPDEQTLETPQPIDYRSAVDYANAHPNDVEAYQAARQAVDRKWDSVGVGYAAELRAAKERTATRNAQLEQQDTVAGPTVAAARAEFKANPSKENEQALQAAIDGYWETE